MEGIVALQGGMTRSRGARCCVTLGGEQAVSWIWGFKNKSKRVRKGGGRWNERKKNREEKGERRARENREGERASEREGDRGRWRERSEAVQAPTRLAVGLAPSSVEFLFVPFYSV